MSLDTIFKAYDIRGRVPDELDATTAHSIGRAVADWLHEAVPATRHQPVIVGRDMRPDSGELADAVIRGLIQQGRNVIDVGRISTDMVYFAVGHLEAAGGIMVTASHNPGADNGMKLCREQARAIGSDSGLDEIKQRVQAGDFQDAAPGAVQSRDVASEWVQHVLSFAPHLRPLQLAVDAGNGMAGVVIPELESQTELMVTPLYFEPDGSFPNHEANPIKTETLADLQHAVRDGGLDVGIAFDGDGDRMVMVDEYGEPVSGSVMCAILSRYFLEQHPGSTIVHNAICSRVVPETIRAYGGQPFRSRVGHSFIKADMREHDAPFGGEHSAHYFFRDNWYADSGLVAALAALEVMSITEQTLSQLAQPYREAYAHSGEMNFEVSDPDVVLDDIAKQLEDGEQDWLDGLTVRYEDWWCNVRPSNTEPLLRLNVEATDADTLQQQLQKLQQYISGY